MLTELSYIWPELVILTGGLILFILPLKSSRTLGLLTLAVLAAGFNLAVLRLLDGPFSQRIFSGMVVQDRFSHFFQIAILGSMFLVVLGLLGYRREKLHGRREVYGLLLLVTVGLLFMVGAQSLVLIYIALELVSIFSYLLTGMLKKEVLSTEAGLKYFLFGALATGVMLYGISLLYGLTSTMDLEVLSEIFPRVMARFPVLCGIALFLLTAGLGFKVALVPFHMWAPDAYEGAPTPVAAFISTAPKLAGFAVLVRFFLVALTPDVTLWPVLLGYLAVLTMTVGNLAALAQENVKRLLAYSSIAHAGTIAIGLAVATPGGLTATMYYLIAYLLMNTGAFLGVIAVGNESGGREDIGAFSGLSRRQPALAFMMTVALLSLAGIPPLAGFFAKMWVFGAALQAGAVGLAVIGAVNSIMAVFYYLKIVKAMYLDPAPAGFSTSVPVGLSLKVALLLCVAGVFLAGLMPGQVLVLSGDALPVSVQLGDLPWLPGR
ncbi:MAG: NADH-quinone oxidoreductase subunit N [Candidatus Omnitrophica bacterium]|nr:NADH-quinone oxidoreductase subunit N [Candidatus Omnitrophota bacterium]